MKIAPYDTNLTDAQWASLKPMLPKPAKRGRRPKDRRRIIDAILYLVQCGRPSRYLPADFPHWKNVYHVFRQWIHNHQPKGQHYLTVSHHRLAVVRSVWLSGVLILLLMSFAMLYAS